MTLASFLDKWLQKKPKRAKGGKSSTMAKRRDEEAYAERARRRRPGTAEFAALTESDVDPSEVFFHRYYATKTEGKKKKKKKGDEDKGPEDSEVGRRVGRRRRDCRAEKKESRQGWTRGVRERGRRGGQRRGRRSRGSRAPGQRRRGRGRRRRVVGQGILPTAEVEQVSTRRRRGLEAPTTTPWTPPRTTRSARKRRRRTRTGSTTTPSPRVRREARIPSLRRREGRWRGGRG